MAEASVREKKLLAGPRVRTEPEVAIVGVVCKVLQVSPKLGSAIDRRRKTVRLTGNLASDVK